MREQVQALLREAVERTLRKIQSREETGWAERVHVIPSSAAEHGDFSSSAALALARPLGLDPRDLARRMVEELRDPESLLARTEIAGPGYINFFLSARRWHAVLARILEDAEQYGRTPAAGREQVQVEFVSANPTGPLTIGHGRNAILGDSIARLLEASGHGVTREYYFNNGGRQMRVLADSLRARYEQLVGRRSELPENGYRGEYLAEIARRLVEVHGDAWLDAGWRQFKDAAEEAIFADIRDTLDRLGIHFDEYTNELALYEEGRVEAALQDLEAAGCVYRAEDATWLKSRDFGLERDRVLIKSTAEPTYLLPDIAYHRQKLTRGFDRVIDVLGPDHLEQFPYVKAAIGALGERADAIEVVVYQWVNLRRGGEVVKMSTREASFVTIDEVLDEVGSDVFRFFMIERRADTHLDFDLELAKEKSERNPVYKIQYAHARMCSIERKAVERGIELVSPSGAPLDRLESPAEHGLCRLLERYPEIVRHAADTREPQEVARYLLALASAFHAYVSDASRHRVLSEDQELSTARLVLVRATRLTLGNGLGLLGIRAPERM